GDAAPRPRLRGGPAPARADRGVPGDRGRGPGGPVPQEDGVAAVLSAARHAPGTETKNAAPGAAFFVHSRFGTARSAGLGHRLLGHGLLRRRPGDGLPGCRCIGAGSGTRAGMAACIAVAGVVALALGSLAVTLAHVSTP